MTKLPKLEAEPTNDTAALTCYALDWRERAIRAESINEELLEVTRGILVEDMLQYLPVVYVDKVRAAITKATGSAS